VNENEYDDDEFITNCFLNPVIDGHIWQFNTNVIHHSKFTVENELQLEYFRNKTAISLEPIETITNNDIVLSDRMNERSPHSEIFKEGRQAWATLNQRNDTVSKFLMKRLLLKMVDEMRHSKDGITHRLVKTHKTMVPMNWQLTNQIEYFEMTHSKAMKLIYDKIRFKIMKGTN
jgi:hypothetical protein